MNGDPTAGGALEVRSLVVGVLESNVYLAACPRTRRAVLIDPAGEPERILAAGGGLKVEAVVATHGHTDHTGAAAALATAWGIPLRLHPADADPAGLAPVSPLSDGEEIRFGEAMLRVLHTPGHTPGSVCFSGAGLLFSGDTLFPGGPGATAGPEEFAAVMGSLGRLFNLPDATRVLPGHGPATTIGAERPHLGEWMRRGW